MSPSPHIAVLIRLSQGLSNIYRPGNAGTVLAGGRNFSLLSHSTGRTSVCEVKGVHAFKTVTGRKTVLLHNGG